MRGFYEIHRFRFCCFSFIRPAVPAKTTAVEEENTQKEKAPALQAARLGDTLDIWTAAYGAPAGDTVYMKRFNNGTVTVIVFKEHIVNIRSCRSVKGTTGL